VVSWKLYSGPGTVTFGDATLTNTTANFSAPGIYTLELSAADGVHAVAYDAVVITVTNGIIMSITFTGTNVNVSWTGGSPPYVVQWAGAFPANPWSDLVTTSANSTNVPLTNITEFFRVIGQ
jgi:PKD repeat protein